MLFYWIVGQVVQAIACLEIIHLHCLHKFLFVILISTMAFLKSEASEPLPER